MKYWLLVIGLGITLFGVAQNVPSIKFPLEKINFGAINEDDGNVSHTFKFVNKGKKPLKIVNVLTTCGCTTPDWTQTEVKSGDSGQVVAVFDPHNKSGRFTKTLTVITNGDPHSVVLTIEGSVYSSNKDMLALFPHKDGSLQFSTNKIVLPAQKEDKIDTVWLGVYNPTNEIMFVYTVASPYMMHAEVKHEVIKPLAGINLMFTYNGAMAGGLGSHLDTIYLLTSDTKQPTKMITIQSKVVQNFDKLTAEQLANAPVATYKETEAQLGQLYQGEIGTYTYEITNTGKSDLVIRDVIADCKCVTATVPQKIIKKGAKGKVVVSYNSFRKHREVEEKFTIITNDPTKPETILKIKAKVVIPGKEPVQY